MHYSSSSIMVTIIDYKTGNMGSIQNMLKKIRVESIITSDPDEISRASKIILPGVGSFDQGMRNLADLRINEILNQKILVEKTPVLGICLGMQLMTLRSEEGMLPGLGWMDAETIRFSFEDAIQYKSPHMGWNFVRQHKESRLLKDMDTESRFYFAHSYYVKSKNPSDILTSTQYEIEFTSSFEKGNIFGVQFHPEKSHKFGMTLLKNFTELY